MSITFADLGAPGEVVAALAATRVTAPLPIQTAPIPDAIAGRARAGAGAAGPGSGGRGWGQRAPPEPPDAAPGDRRRDGSCRR